MILLFRVRLATRSSISLGTWLMIALGCTCLFAQHDEIVHSAVTLSIPGVQVEPTKIALVQEALPLEQSAENSDAPTYGTWQIGRIAWHQSTLAHLMCREASALELMGHKAKPHSQELASRFLRKNSSRLAQISSEQAMILHSGLFAALQGRPLLLQSLSALDAAIEQQNVAIQNGIPIEDPTKLKGQRIEAQDRYASNELLIHKLRSQLLLLIPRDVACPYIPTQDLQEFPIPEDLCTEIAAALTRRCDLIALRELSQNLTRQDLELARSIIGKVIGTTLVVDRMQGLGSLANCLTGKADDELCMRRSQLDEATKMLERQISNQVEQHWLEWKTSAERLRLARELVEVRKERIQQLQAMGELGKPLPGLLLIAKAEWIQAEGEAIERAHELREAILHWLSSTGQLSF
ncbi:MAG: TolC family protein [Pirellulales bacterium]